MKKIILSYLIIAVTLLVACEPIEVRDSVSGNVTVEALALKVTPKHPSPSIKPIKNSAVNSVLNLGGMYGVCKTTGSLMRENSFSSNLFFPS